MISVLLESMALNREHLGGKDRTNRVLKNTVKNLATVASIGGAAIFAGHRPVRVEFRPYSKSADIVICRSLQRHFKSIRIATKRRLPDPVGDHPVSTKYGTSPTTTTQK